MAFKTYHLLDHMHPKMTNLYVRVNKDQRIRKDKLPAWRPYLQMTFTDKDGQNRTIRYKANTSEIYQDAQIKLGILANEKTQPSERDDVEFVNGTLTTGSLTVQNYLETYPGFAGFKGYCNDIRQPQYKIYDAEQEIESDNSDFLKRLQVGQMVAKLDLKGAQDLLLRLNGGSYVVPDKLAHAQNQLVKWMNLAEEEGLDEMLRVTMTDDEKATVLIGKLLNAGLIQFDFIQGQVIKKKNGRDIVVKNISADNIKEQQRLFVEYITSDAGKALYQDLENDLAAREAPKSSEPVYESFTMPETPTIAAPPFNGEAYMVKPKENGEDSEKLEEDDKDVELSPSEVAKPVAVKKATKKKKPKKRHKPAYSAKPKLVTEEVANNIHEPENILDNGM